MNDPLNEALESGAKGAAEGFAKGIASKVPPLYPDLFQPAVREIGTGLRNTVKLLLAPVTGSIWAYDKIAEWLDRELEAKLANVSQENLISPSAAIVGPAIEAIKFLEKQEELRELYAQLISSSLNRDFESKLHPGFVEIIKNLSSNDAKVLRYIFSIKKFHYLELRAVNHDSPTIQVPMKYLFSLLDDEIVGLKDGGINSIINLKRLGLIETLNYSTTDKNIYEKIRKKPIYQYIRKENPAFISYESYYELTSLGELFSDCCIRL